MKIKVKELKMLFELGLLPSYLVMGWMAHRKQMGKSDNDPIKSLAECRSEKLSRRAFGVIVVILSILTAS